MQLITAPSQSINFSIEDNNGCLVTPDDDSIVSIRGRSVSIRRNYHSYYFNGENDLSFHFPNRLRNVVVCGGDRCSIKTSMMYDGNKYVLGNFSFVQCGTNSIIKVGNNSVVKTRRRSVISVGDNSTIHDCYGSDVTVGKNCVILLTEGHYHYIKAPDNLTIKITDDGNWITTTKDWCTSRNLNNEVLMYLTLKYGESITMEQLTIENQL